MAMITHRHFITLLYKLLHFFNPLEIMQNIIGCNIKGQC